MQSALTPETVPAASDATRSRKLQLLGILSGFTAGAWLGAAEAPTKLVSIGISPLVISLIMVIGVFLARWSLPALVLGTASIRADVRRAPHLLIWAVLAGCLWAVANTLTIFAIRDIGLSIAFPLWNANSLLGIVWGAVFFNELHGAGWRRRRDVRGRDVARGRVGGRGTLGTCGARCRRGARGRCAVGHDVHPLSQSLPHRHEPAGLHHILHGGRIHDDAGARARRPGRRGRTRRGARRRARRAVLAAARR